MTSALAARARAAPNPAGRQLVRLVPAPGLEPPFEGEATGERGRSRVVAEVPRDAIPGSVGGCSAPPNPVSACAPPGRRGDAARTVGIGQPQRLPPEGAPAAGDVPETTEAGMAARRYLALCLEVLGGFRPVAHLRPLTSDEVLDQVTTEMARPRSTRRIPGPPGAPSRHAAAASREVRAGPPLSGPRFIPAPDGHIRLRRWLMCEPRDGVAEVAAILGRAGQVWAVALRMERRRGTWMCTHMDVL